MSPLRVALPYLRLVRLPAVFSAWSNILAAHLIATGGKPQWSLLGTQLVICTSLYWGGMVLNDCFDLAEDRRDRPQRPLPSGQVPVPVAWVLGFGLLTFGTLVGLAAGGSLILPTLLLTCAVLLYDGWLKRGPLAPLAMGACRYLSWMLGLAAAPILPPELLLALPVLVYTAGVTVLSSIETKGERRGPVLATAALLFLAGLGILALHIGGVQTEAGALIGLGLLLAILGRDLRHSVREPDPKRIRKSVGLLLTAMIPLDAVLLAGDGQWGAALGMLLLVIPGQLLRQRLYVT